MSFIKKRAPKDFDIIIGLGSSIDGEIKSSGSIRIDGSVSGNIVTQGDVIVGVDAKVNADIKAQYCEISGKVKGNVHSESQLRIFQSGSLEGDIIVSSFAIEEGGMFNGNCDINSEKRPSAKPSFNKSTEDNKKNKTNDKSNEKINDKTNDKSNDKTNNKIVSKK